MTGILNMFAGGVLSGGTEVFTMTAGNSSASWGYDTTPSAYGSLSNSGLLAGGYTITELRNSYTEVTFPDPETYSDVYLKISGFGADPGQDYINQLYVAGNTFGQADAGYSYAGGIATWQWGGTGYTQFWSSGTHNCWISYA